MGLPTLRKVAVLHLCLLPLHAADLLTISMASPEQEANPLMKTLWIQNGFSTLILAKIASWLVGIALYLAIWKWQPHCRQTVIVGQITVLVIMVLVVVNNSLVVF